MPPKSTPSDSGIDPVLIAILFIIAIVVFGVFFNSVVFEYSNVLNWFYSKEWQDIFSTIRIIIILFDIGLIVFTFIVTRKLLELQKKAPEEKAAAHIAPPKEVIREAWEGISKLGNSENPSDWNMAILRADALLDDILRDLGYEGDTIADRLKIVDPHKLKSVEQIWSAHRLRNIIAHDPVTQHMKETTSHALKSYEQAFKELDMMG
ncbi:MAG: hypothetical protein HYT37_01405 [Candidatus Sungbacteria bacterium]|nr:hypothetical protein [Candidatus Sungbacteria bacterium]